MTDLEKKIKNTYKVGDTVVCIKEPNVPSYIGHRWVVINISSAPELYYCINALIHTGPEGFPFRSSEITLMSSLMEELL